VLRRVCCALVSIRISNFYNPMVFFFNSKCIFWGYLGSIAVIFGFRDAVVVVFGFRIGSVWIHVEMAALEDVVPRWCNGETDERWCVLVGLLLWERNLAELVQTWMVAACVEGCGKIWGCAVFMDIGSRCSLGSRCSSRFIVNGVAVWFAWVSCCGAFIFFFFFFFFWLTFS